jgi:Protein of unknown function (DUF3631)
MATKDILAALAALDEAPWGDIHGKPIDARGLANHLRPYGVKSGTVRVSEKDTPKGYKREHLIDVWRRYLPPAGEAPQAPQPPLSAAFETADVADVADGDDFVADDNRSDGAEKPNETCRVADVADVADFQGDGDEASESYPPVCQHCGSPERLVLETWCDGEQYWLHPECQDEFWPDDLAIPPSLRRAP